MTGNTPLRDVAGRFAGQGAFRAMAPAPATLFTPLADADQRLRVSLSHAFDLLEAQPVVEEGEPVPAAAIAASPGAGKSRVARELLARRAGEESIAYHAPTLDLTEEAAAHAAKLRTHTELVRGRSARDPSVEDPDQTMCVKSDLVERALRLGLNIRESFCASSANPECRCAYFESCAYMRQFSKPGEEAHRYLATSYLGFPDPTGATFALRVIDETFWSQQLIISTFSAADFLLPRTFLRHMTPKGEMRQALVARHADLLVAARAVVDVLAEGGSPMSLPYSEQDYRRFAELERRSHAPDPKVVPDQAEGLQSALLTEAERNVRYVSWFSALWTCLAEAKSAKRSSVERLRMIGGRDGPRLRLCRKRDLLHREPMLLLDADADPDILTALGCDLQMITRMVLRPNAEVVQVHDRRMTHGSLLDGRELREAWRRVIRREVLADRASHGGGVLVGASRKVVLAFFGDAGVDFSGKTDEEVSEIMLTTELHGAHWLWFGGRALGSNRYRDCGTAIVIGREELPATALEDYGRALWGDRDGVDLQLLPPGADGALRMPEVETAYEMRDGSAWAVKVPCHPDPLIRRIQLQTRELATRQLVERLRLARSETRKRVILGCSLPIPGLPVDRLVRWQDFCPRRHEAALIDALLTQGGLRFSAAGFTEDAPSLFPTLDTAKSYLRRNRTRPGDLLAGLPQTVLHNLYRVVIHRDAAYARKETAFVLAESEADAILRAGVIWGPLKSCGVLRARGAQRA